MNYVVIPLYPEYRKVFDWSISADYRRIPPTVRILSRSSIPLFVFSIPHQPIHQNTRSCLVFPRVYGAHPCFNLVRWACRHCRSIHDEHYQSIYRLRKTDYGEVARRAKVRPRSIQFRFHGKHIRHYNNTLTTTPIILTECSGRFCCFCLHDLYDHSIPLPSRTRAEPSNYEL